MAEEARPPVRETLARARRTCEGARAPCACGGTTSATLGATYDRYELTAAEGSALLGGAGALPSGVHEKTLETLELIFSRIGPYRLSRDLAFYSEGIFPLYRHASYQVRDAPPRMQVGNAPQSRAPCAWHRRRHFARSLSKKSSARMDNRLTMDNELRTYLKTLPSPPPICKHI